MTAVMSWLGSGKKPRSLSDNLERAALEPEAWNDVCDGLAEIVNASGTLILPYDVSDRNFGMPHSPRLGEMMTSFIETGWHRRDFRSNGFPRAMSIGFVTDHDLISDDDMRRHPYYQEWLPSVGLRWFAGFCFKAGSKIWGAAVQGTAARGPFLPDDVDRLMKTRDRLSLAAKQSATMGNKRIMSLESAFASSGRGVVVLDFMGRVAWLNAAAEATMRDSELISNNSIRSKDAAIDRQLINLVERALAFKAGARVLLAAPILVPTRDGRAVSVDAIPMPHDFQSLLAGSAVLVTTHEVDIMKSAPVRDLRARFNLTARELELCTHLLAGRKLAQAAELMGMSVATARQYSKSVFAKTGTHGQAEVVALLGRLAMERPSSSE